MVEGSFLSENEGGVYVHVPFCSHKCPYCHFFVLPNSEESKKFYLATLKKEWASKKHLLTKIKTLYIGGGTPSLLSVSQVQEILSLFDVEGEITLEANPENVTLEKMKGYLDLGVNRLSIGIQSLDEEDLVTIDRRHSARKGIEAVQTVYEAGFRSISIDLMYDLPHQSLASWKRTIKMALTLPITHLSLYNLTFEIGSSFYKRKEALKEHLPPDETSKEMLLHAIDALTRAGFSRYEISAFAKKGFEAKHNSSYWTGIPFLGLGPSAFSYYKGRRFRNIPHLKKWGDLIDQGKDPIDFEETLPFPDNILELFAIRLRLAKGVPLSDFPTLPATTLATLKALAEDSLITLTQERASLTEKGKLFYDTVASELI